VRRLGLGLALLATVALMASAGSFALFTQTRSNSASASTAATFLPVSRTAPSVAGTVALLQSLTATPGAWGYDHSGLTGVDTSGEPSISGVTDQWQWCATGLAASCVDIAGATAPTLSLTSTLLTQLGLLSLSNIGFRVKETVTNTYGTASPSFSNIVTG